jgi:hypothetical protein
MAVKFSVEVRNAVVDSIESTIGPSARLIMYTGSPPANTAAASTGTVISTMVLPADWLNTASGGVKTLNGTWTTTASATGTIGYYRIFDSTVTVCHEQGNVTISGGGGDMTLDNVNAANGQTITILSKTYTAGGA